MGRIHITLTSLLVGYLLAGCSILNQSTDTMLKDSELVENLEQTLEINAWGEVKYNDEFQINIDFPAVVQTINVREGDRLKKGDSLATLDMSEFNSLMEKMDSSVKTGESVLNNTYQDISGIEAQIIQARKDISNAQRDVNNYQELYNSGAVSMDVLIQYTSILSNYQTNLRVLEVKLEQLKKSNTSNIDVQTNEVDSLKKDLQINLNKKNKEYLEGSNLVCNLENAIVKKIYVKNGSLLGVSGITVMELIDADSVYVSAEVEEEFIKDIDFDTVVRIVPTMNPEIELTGTVSQIASIAEEKNGNRIIKVQVAVDDSDKILKPGYTAEVYFSVTR